MKIRNRRPSKSTVEQHTFNSERVESGWFYPDQSIIRLKFPDGVMWEYERCTIDEWVKLKTAPSAGRFVRDVLDDKPHHAAKA